MIHYKNRAISLLERTYKAPYVIGKIYTENLLKLKLKGMDETAEILDEIRSRCFENLFALVSAIARGPGKNWESKWNVMHYVNANGRGKSNR